MNMEKCVATRESTTKQKACPPRPDLTIPISLAPVLQDFDNTFCELQRTFLTFEKSFEETYTLDSIALPIDECLRNVTEKNAGYEDILDINIKKLIAEVGTIRGNNIRIMGLMLQCTKDYQALKDVSDTDQISTRLEMTVAARLASMTQQHFMKIRNLMQENVQKMNYFCDIQKFITNNLCQNIQS